MATAPFIPFAPGVNTISAPNKASNFLRSIDIVSGMVRISLYPLAAATNAKAIPVFPLVGSINIVSSLITPASSPASIIATPILSFTLERGLKDSSLTTTSAFEFFVNLFNLTNGVFPIVSVMSFAIPLVNLGILTIFSPSSLYYFNFFQYI